ncbi:Putative membrane lipoprotein [Prunus dulcis]|uniref:Membrane lipoprotein n=1 Tax=Prunus dulcis TaxID=3755 RepID=A0A5H2Y4I2_PRUDU|nr:Putative membrane lipoprotein [Prunus dulcis]
MNNKIFGFLRVKTIHNQIKFPDKIFGFKFRMNFKSLEFILLSFSMEEFRRCLERQERETNERNRRADEINELQRQVDEQVLIAVALQEEENQGRRGSQVGCARMWKDIGILGCDAAGVLGLLPEQKLTAVIRMLAYGASADQVDEIARMGKSTTLEALVRFCQAVETLYTRDYLRRPTPRDLQRLLQKPKLEDSRNDW